MKYIITLMAAFEQDLQTQEKDVCNAKIITILHEPVGTFLASASVFLHSSFVYRDDEKPKYVFSMFPGFNINLKFKYDVIKNNSSGSSSVQLLQTLLCLSPAGWCARLLLLVAFLFLLSRDWRQTPNENAGRGGTVFF